MIIFSFLSQYKIGRGNMKNKAAILCMLFIFTMCSIPEIIFAQRYMEKLNRGLIAVKSGSGYFLSWRLFGTDSFDTSFGFNIYKGNTKINAAVIINATCYQDNSTTAGIYTVKPVVAGVEGPASEPALVLAQNYLSIPLQVPTGYTANDASVGDLDGDGQYEIVLKYDPSNSKDNSQDGVTSPTIIDACKLDGTRMWRINLGKNIRSGAHYTPYIVYDLDGDGCSEIAMKTADGTVDGTGKTIGSATANWVNSTGRIESGPEYFTIFDGTTGAADTTVDYIPPRGNKRGWGGIGGNGGNDTGDNRNDRYLACAAYLDGVRPSVIMCRGYYGRTVMAAWDWRNHSLTSRWVFDSQDSTSHYSGMGNHNLSVADVDNDGKDEIVYGSMCVDNNGLGLYTTMLRHGDAMDLAVLDPTRSGMQVFGIHENEAVIKGLPGYGASLFDAATGTNLYGFNVGTDVGRGRADCIMPGKGCAMWWNTSNGLYSCRTGKLIGSQPASCNFVIWWDGSLIRALEDGTTISKYGGTTLLSATGCSSNNSSKSTPCLTADIFGDWREEVIYRTTDNTALRIYTTTTPTTNRIYTLMHDPAYRLAIAWQNVGYNQPPHTDYYLGDSMTLPPPRPNITYYGTSTVLTNKTVLREVGSSKSEVIKIRADMRFAFAPDLQGRSKSVMLYDCRGILVRQMLIESDQVNLHIDFGVPEGMYIMRIMPGKIIK
jgi:rhamnogalacturonan endolyase